MADLRGDLPSGPLGAGDCVGIDRRCRRCRGWRSRRLGGNRAPGEKDAAAAGLIVVGRILLVVHRPAMLRHFLAHVDHEVAEMHVRPRQRRRQHAGEHRIGRLVVGAEAVERRLAEAGAVDGEHAFRLLPARQALVAADRARQPRLAKRIVAAGVDHEHRHFRLALLDVGDDIGFPDRHVAHARFLAGCPRSAHRSAADNCRRRWRRHGRHRTSSPCRPAGSCA